MVARAVQGVVVVAVDGAGPTEEQPLADGAAERVQVGVTHGERAVGRRAPRRVQRGGQGDVRQVETVRVMPPTTLLAGPSTSHPD